LATPFEAVTLQMKKLRDRIELQHSFPSPVFMEYLNRKLIALKEKELATLDQRASARRSTLERELATLDEQTQREREKLERQIGLLQEAAQIEEETLRSSKAPVKVYTKQEREELFTIRSNVMRRLLDDAHGREIHSKQLADVLNRPESTIKDYYNEQLELRPSDCFWQTGVDKAHFRWKDGFAPQNEPPSYAPHVAQQSPTGWHATV
jgi:hypothetical protein